MSGQRDRIKITIPTRNRVGIVKRTIRITTNDPNQRRTVLTCSARVNQPLKNASPTLNFGQIRRQTPAVTKKILLSRGDGGPIAPELMHIRQPGITAQIRTIQEGSHYELTATFSPPWPNGRVNTAFTIKTGVKQAPTARIRIVANVEPRVTTSPRHLVIPLGGDSVEQSVRIRWSPGGDRRVVEANATDPRLSVRIEESGGYQMVVVSAPKGYQSPARPVAVTLHTDDGEIPIYSVPVHFKQPRRRGRPVSASRRSSRSPSKKKCDTDGDTVQSVSGIKSR